MRAVNINMEPPHADITIIAHPGARNDSIKLDDDGSTIIVHVTAPPEKGKANKAIIKIIAKKTGLSSSRVTILQGATSSTKRIRVEGVNDASLKERLFDVMD
jgi:uncharacterized protein (TIGR00251 family)